MKFNKFTFKIILLIAVGRVTLDAQPYTDYILGAGHANGLTATASSTSGASSPLKSINGSGMDALFFEASRFMAQATLGGHLKCLSTLFYLRAMNFGLMTIW